MSAARILVVEDEQAIADLVAFGLRRAGFDVDLAGDCATARIRIADARPDLVLMDWMLPDSSGLEFTRQLKKRAGTREIPIIMLTARAAELDKVQGLEGGADDYVTKPFSARELVARIRAVLRRGSGPDNGAPIALGGLVLDSVAQRVSAEGTFLALGPTEYRLLAYFMTHPERVCTRAHLLDRVWGASAEVGERAVDVHVRRLRQALEPVGCEGLLQTVRGSGYRFSTQPP